MHLPCGVPFYMFYSLCKACSLLIYRRVFPFNVFCNAYIVKNIPIQCHARHFTQTTGIMLCYETFTPRGCITLSPAGYSYFDVPYRVLVEIEESLIQNWAPSILLKKFYFYVLIKTF